MTADADSQLSPDGRRSRPKLTAEYRVELRNPDGVVLNHIYCASRDLAQAWGTHFFDHERCTWTVQKRMVGPWVDDGPAHRTVTTVETVETPGPVESAQGGECAHD